MENEIKDNRLPIFDDMGYDPDETPRRIVIPTEPGESIEVPTTNFLTTSEKTE